MIKKNEMLKFILICFCIAVATTVVFTSLGYLKIGNHEAFVSVTAQEMIKNNEYIIPTFNNEYRLNKTPLPYWLVVAVAHFTGNIDEFTSRLPSAIMAFLSVLCILYFITVILDFRTAFLSSMIWTCSLGFVRYSHSARPEMLLTFFMITCFLSFYAAIEETDRIKQVIYSLIFWISLGLSILAKAPSSVFFMTFSVIIYLSVFRQWKNFKKILPIWGLIICLLIALPWPILAANAMNWDMSLWKQESIGRFTGNFDANIHRHRWLYYFPRMFQFIIPWVAFLPIAVIAPFLTAWKDKRKIMGYLWISLFAGVIFLSLCSGKRQHYILPLMPLAAILIGIIMEDMVFSRTIHREKEGICFLKWHIFTLFAIGLVILAFTFEPLYNYTAKLIANSKITLPMYANLPIGCQIATGLVLVLGMPLSIYFYSIKKQIVSCLLIFGSIAFVIIFAFSLLSVLPDNDKYIANMGLEIKNMIPIDDKVFIYGQENESLIYYFGRPIKSVSNIDIEKFYNNNYWLIISDKNIDKIRKEYSFREIKVYSTYDNNKEIEQFVLIHKNPLNDANHLINLNNEI
jgi:4-amino-4-deoxy-L-arabinose transferase-like glycosyltransferase